MQRKFMLVYRHFRLKKYGEPIPVPKSESKNSDLEDIFKDDAEMLLKIKAMLNQQVDMEAIKEKDEVDEISDFGSEANENQEAIGKT